MSAVLALHPLEGGRPVLPRDVALLLDYVDANRFLPTPPDDANFVGDGDYRAIGAEFLRHFVEIGGLRRSHRVLDVGSGIGRMAVPLTQFLPPERGSYEGFDPVREGVDWCTRTITAAYPGFCFQHLDIAHPLYNPGGAVRAEDLAFPYGDGSFDFALMVSVATHLLPGELDTYLREIRRVLAPGGRLFLTAFVMDASVLDAEGRDPRLGFARHEDGPCWYADPQAPLAAVGFDDGFLDGLLLEAGFSIEKKGLGHWRGRPAPHYQDVFVATCTGGDR